MLQTLQQILAPPVMERLTLLANHVLRGEAAATSRLAPHSGKVVQLETAAWPALLPALPAQAWRVTPAGLLEWCGVQRDLPADLTVRVQADNPALLAARLCTGEAPTVEIVGDTQLAADVDWLLHNLRWDVAADLERVFPPAVADGLHRAGQGLARGLRAALQGVDGLRDRWRPR